MYKKEIAGERRTKGNANDTDPMLCQEKSFGRKRENCDEQRK